MNAKAIIPVLLAIFMPSLAHASETPPQGGEPRPYTLPDVQRYALDNGLRYTLVPFGNVPKVAILVAVRTGNLDEGDDTWLADLTGAMLKEGTSERSARRIALDAAAMGGALNVSVSVHETALTADVLSERGAEMIRLMGEVLRTPSLPESELPRLRQNFKRSLSVALTQPGNQASLAFRRLLYGDHPYARLFPAEAQLDGYDLQAVRDFHRRNFGAARTRIYVAGRFDVTGMRRAIEATFGDWKVGPAPSRTDADPARRLQVSLVDRPGAPQSTIYAGTPVPDPSHPDRVALTLTNTLLGGYFSSRITANLREDKGYAYSPRSQLSHRVGDSHWVQVADVTTEATAAALGEIVAELQRLRAEPPGADELERTQNYRSGTFVLGNATRGGLIGQLAFLDLHGLALSALENFVSDVYAVTPEGIRDTAQRYLDPRTLSIAIVGDLSVIVPQLTGLPFLEGVELGLPES